ncbi:hypothetical protein [Streptomyces sp. 1222.2]|uniref:hypothetical protein n=1 Tax=Streptomyces sp. 1222.2 TaxID=1938833 RepID=UPI00211C2F7A|nr:hypothetical protein [Streptomyces sp. 1222.2]
MSDIEYPSDLVELESAAWAEIQAGRLTVATAQAVHQGIAEFVARDDVTATRLDVEMGLKRAVRHPADA